MYDLFTLILENSKSQHVALKILTAESHSVENPVFEMEILKHISTADRNHAGYNHVIHLLDNFQHSGPNGQHLCLVFQVMGETVGSLLRRCPNRQIPVVLAKKNRPATPARARLSPPIMRRHSYRSVDVINFV